MNQNYDDIISRITEEPKWFDEHAVPRFCDFAPSECANIYAGECCLLLIKCQSCDREFKVAMAWATYDDYKVGDPAVGAIYTDRRLSTNIKDIHYGDPPNVECCPASPTMNSVPVRVLEFWAIEKHEWVRKPELEIELPELVR